MVESVKAKQILFSNQILLSKVIWFINKSYRSHPPESILSIFKRIPHTNIYPTALKALRINPRSSDTYAQIV